MATSGEHEIAHFPTDPDGTPRPDLLHAGGECHHGCDDPNCPSAGSVPVRIMTEADMARAREHVRGAFEEIRDEYPVLGRPRRAELPAGVMTVADLQAFAAQLPTRAAEPAADDMAPGTAPQGVAGWRAQFGRRIASVPKAIAAKLRGKIKK